MARTCVPPQSSTEKARRALIAVARLAHRDDADLIAIFLAEQRHRAGGNRIVHRHEPRHHGAVLQDHRVGEVFNLG